MKWNIKLLAVLAIGIMASNGIIAQERIGNEEEIYYSTRDTVYVLKISNQVDGNDPVFQHEILNCQRNIGRIWFIGVENLTSFFELEIPKAGIRITENIILYKYKGGNNEKLAGLRIVYLGKLLEMDVKRCLAERDQDLIFEVTNFLNERGYKVESNCEMTTSLKAGIVNYYKDSGIPSCLLTEGLYEIFEIDKEAMENRYCECIVGQMKK